MKRYIKAFIPDFRPSLGPDISFDLLDFQEEDFVCPIEKEEAGIYIISTTDGTKYIYPNGKSSPILYIGKSDNLLRRLRDEHFSKGLKRLLDDPDYGIADNIQIAPRYQYMYYKEVMWMFLDAEGNRSPKIWSRYFLINSIRNIEPYLLETVHALMRYKSYRLTLSPQPKVRRFYFP